MENMFSIKDIKNKVSSNDLVYDNISTHWGNGMFVGGGSIGAISYSRNNLEWIINKNDVFDSRASETEQKTHREVKEHINKHNEKDFKFMSQFEKVTKRVALYSITPVILRFNFGSGDLGWDAPALPKVSQRLSLYEGKLYSEADAAFIHGRFEVFSPHNKNLFVMRVEGCSTLDWGHLIELYRPFHEEMELPEWKYENDVISFTQKLPGGGSYAVAVYIKNRELDAGRVKYDMINDDEAIDAFFKLSRLEGIIPAIESSHAVAYAMKLAKEMKRGSILLCLSGRGDKDMDYVIENYGIR